MELILVGYFVLVSTYTDFTIFILLSKLMNVDLFTFVRKFQGLKLESDPQGGLNSGSFIRKEICVC